MPRLNSSRSTSRMRTESSGLDEVRSSLGAIGVLVHGAGVEESRLIADKDETAFHRVFDGKAEGGLHPRGIARGRRHHGVHGLGRRALR